jgi:UDP-N-acetylglucosamine 1-carboxyvinyltransferase
MSKFIVRPGPSLSGTVVVSGAKNSVLKLMAACLLAPGRHTLRNVPRITDVAIMMDLLTEMGVISSWESDNILSIDVPEDLSPEARYEHVEKMRASIVVLGPLVSRLGQAKVSMPGGDDFGSRPIGMHLNGLESMGAISDISHGYVNCHLPPGQDRLVGARIVLEFPSHTTTDNLMMAAVLAKGTTIIENAAREPEVVDLASFLDSMGARIQGAGTSRIEIEGVDSLTPSEHSVIPDRVETATFLAAVGIAGGEINLMGGRFNHLDMFIEKMGEMGVRISPTQGGLWALSPGRLESTDIATLPYPGVATDYKPLVTTLLTVAEGVGIVTENLFSGRFKYIDELKRMGADIRTEGHHAVIRGVPKLSGTIVRASDIRAGAALVLAGMVAEGETTVMGIDHIDRGYENFDKKLSALGADIVRVQ